MDCDFGMSSFWFGLASGAIATLVALFTYAKVDDAVISYRRDREDAKEYRRTRGW
jgi:hypothetical protein